MSFFSRLFKDKRGDEIKSLAYHLDMQYTKRDRYGLKKLLGQFQLFREGGGRKITNLLKKEDEWLQSKVAVFDYQYTISTGKSSQTFYQTVFFIQSKKLSLPQFLIKPEHFFHRVGKFLKLTQDIEFEEHPEFSKKFLIQGDEASLVKDALPDELARFFTIEKKWSLEGMNYFLIFYQKHKRLPPESIGDFYKKGMKIYEWLQENKEI